MVKLINTKTPKMKPSLKQLIQLMRGKQKSTQPIRRCMSFSQAAELMNTTRWKLERLWKGYVDGNLEHLKWGNASRGPPRKFFSEKQVKWLISK